jgi:hypothetical protein
MSRHKDRTECGGEISEGIVSVLVGGEPSKQGEDLPEDESPNLAALDRFFAVASAASAAKDLATAKKLTAGLVLKAINTSAKAVGVDTGAVGSGAEAIAEGDWKALVTATLQGMGQSNAANIWDAARLPFGERPKNTLAVLQDLQTGVTGLQALGKLGKSGS